MSSETLLSPQQRIVFQYLVDGTSFKEVAELMGIRRSTIGKYVQRVKKKMGAKNLLQCIAILVVRHEVEMTDVGLPKCLIVEKPRVQTNH